MYAPSTGLRPPRFPYTVSSNLDDHELPVVWENGGIREGSIADISKSSEPLPSTDSLIGQPCVIPPFQTRPASSEAMKHFLHRPVHVPWEPHIGAIVCTTYLRHLGYPSLKFHQRKQTFIGRWSSSLVLKISRSPTRQMPCYSHHIFFVLISTLRQVFLALVL